MCFSWPLSTSHNRIRNPPAPASVVPSGENATEVTREIPPVSVYFICPVSTYHNRISFQLPLASVFPSGENATEVTEEA